MSDDETPSPPQSPRMTALKEAVAGGNTAAVDTFWEEIAASGTPLMEPHPDRSDATLVTFLWRETEPVESVTVLHFFHGKTGSDEDRLQKIAGTDVWYRTMPVHSAMRAVYQLAFDDDLSPITPQNAKERTARWRPDPLNHRNFVRLPAAEGEEAKLDSPLELPAAPQPWLGRHEGVATGSETHHTFRSSVLDNERIIHVYTPPGFDVANGPWPLLLHFDAQWRETPMQVPATLDNLIAAGRIPPTVAVFIENIDRNTELPCNERYAEALATELIPWLQETYAVTRDPARIVAAGQSYGGLASLWLALQHPEVVGNVLSQSGSFWWMPGYFELPSILIPGDAPQGEWLTQQVVDRPAVPVRIWMQAGTVEIGPDLHPYTSSLVMANRTMHTVLRLRGYDVHYEEYVGGHDFLTWRGSLADGLIHLLGS